METEKLAAQLTAEEKTALVSGTDFMYTNPVPRLNIPSVRMSDGPHGLRVQTKGDNGVTGSRAATAFPTAATAANGWNGENLKKIGQAIARECCYYGVDVLLGPGVNIKRNPLCGRNFEYFSEDPYLAGILAVAQIRAVQQGGVGVCLKHFALNNAETFRFSEDCIADMRAMRELYLRVFEIAVKEGKPWAVMSAYNRVNGEFCSQNAWLLRGVLREEWGFDGVVMSDWGGIHERVTALQAGLDLEMPGDAVVCRKWIFDGLKTGALDEFDLNAAARNVLNLVEKCSHRKDGEVDFEAHHGLSAEIAADCAVLLQNDGTLPLRDSEKLCVMGDFFEHLRYQGAGSSMVNPAFLTSPKQAFDERGVSYLYARGYDRYGAKKRRLIEEALKIGKRYERVLLFAGLADDSESEGADRQNMRLPQNQLDLIEALLGAGKKITLVLFGGAPVELPFADRLSAILAMYLPGQNGGTACARLLFGEVCPSGKLAETWVKTYADVPFGNEYSKEPREVYKESVFVGYRYYTTARKEVRFPFGFGLSYTSFQWSDMRLTERDGTIEVSCAVENTGAVDGADVVQLYVSAPESKVFRPLRELRAFAKIYLKAGEKQRVSLSFARSDLAYWNEKMQAFLVESGKYDVQLCRDCESVALSFPLEIAGEPTPAPYSEQVQSAYCGANLAAVTNELFEEMSGRRIPALPPRAPVTIESRFQDIRRTLVGRILYALVMLAPRIQARRAKRKKEGAERDNAQKGALFMRLILENSTLWSMTMAASTHMPYSFAEAFVHIGNGRLFKGLACFMKKIKVPKLPKDQNNGGKRLRISSLSEFS